MKLLRRDDDLHHEPTSREEITELLRLVERDLAQAKITGLYPDGRFTFAYNAALQLATAFLRVHHVRVGATSHHFRTFQELKHLLPSDQRRFALTFEHARRKRNVLMYDQAGAVSDYEVQEFIVEVKEFHEWFVHELRTRFREYMPSKKKGGIADEKLS